MPTKPVKKTALDKILSFVIAFVEANKGMLLKRFGDIINLKRTVRRYAVLLIASLVGLIIILDGLATFISSLYPAINPGLIHMAVGGVLIASALVYNKISK